MTFVTIQNTQDINIRLVNTNGQNFIIPFNIKNSGIELDVSELENGLYLLMITNEKGLKTGKLMVE